MDRYPGDKVKTIHFSVTGRVQGVFFRASCKEVAGNCGVSGWVRNTPDGRVEGVATGVPADLEHFTRWLEQGPVAARVEKVELTDLRPEVFEGFQIR